MPKVVGYHRPASVDEALALLARPGTAVLGGGTVLNATRAGAPVEAVDVRDLGLGSIDASDAVRVRIGASVTLQQLHDDPVVPSGLRDLARRELPSTLRTLATVGGTVAVASWESQLLAGMLVHDAAVTLEGPTGRREHPLPEVLAAPGLLAGALVTAVTIAVDGSFAAARTARTPGDVPIVAAAARRGDDGRVRTALTGVASVPLLVDDPTGLAPPGDFRGSPEYRRHVAGVLLARVRREVGA